MYAGNNEVTAVVGGVSPFSTSKYDDHATYGIRVGVGIKNILIDQLEAGYDYSRNAKYERKDPSKKDESSIQRLYFNAIKEFDISESIKSPRPTNLYALLGIGYQRFSKELPTEESRAFGQYGFGLKYYFTNSVALRAEVRNSIRFDTPHKANLFYSLGLAYVFGEKTQEATPVPQTIAEELPKNEPTPVINEEPKDEPATAINDEEPKEAVVKAIFFDSNSAEISDGADSIIQGIADDFRAEYDINIKVLIKGHTDSTGSDSYNLQLSQKRVESVKTRLTEKGVLEDAITTKSYGKTEPLEPNTTREGRAKNRRVEILFAQ
jgi:OOP family OmpA-OmpF porin